MSVMTKKTRLTAVLTALMITSAIVLAGGCQTFHKMYPAPTKPACDDPEYQGIVCDLFRRAGIEPEQYQDVILDATDLALILDPELGAKVKGFTAAVRMKIDKDPLLMLSEYVGFAEQQAKVMGIKQILSRRIEVLDVDVQLDDGSYNLIMAHLDAIDAEVDQILGN